MLKNDKFVKKDGNSKINVHLIYFERQNKSFTGMQMIKTFRYIL